MSHFWCDASCLDNWMCAFKREVWKGRFWLAEKYDLIVLAPECSHRQKALYMV